GAIPVEKHQEDLRRRGRWSGRGGRDRGGPRRRRESVDQAGDKVVGTVAGAIAKIGIRDAEGRLGGGKISVVEIEGEGRAEVISYAVFCLKKKKKENRNTIYG